MAREIRWPLLRVIDTGFLSMGVEEDGCRGQRAAGRLSAHFNGSVTRNGAIPRASRC